jgi:hypothetical protein
MKYLKMMTLTTALISVCAWNDARSDAYKWIDKAGTINYSDTPPNDKNIIYNKYNDDPQKLPIEERKKIPGFDPVLDEIYNNVFAVNNEISLEMKGWITQLIGGKILSRKDIDKIITEEEARVVVDYILRVKPTQDIKINEVFEIKPNSKYSSPEKTWAAYNNARIYYDKSAALDCMIPQEREKLNIIFNAIKKEDMVLIGKSVISFSRVNEETNKSEYLMKYNKGGRTMSQEFKFIKIWGNWKMINH